MEFSVNMALEPNLYLRDDKSFFETFTKALKEASDHFFPFDAFVRGLEDEGIINSDERELLIRMDADKKRDGQKESALLDTIALKSIQTRDGIVKQIQCVIKPKDVPYFLYIDYESMLSFYGLRTIILYKSFEDFKAKVAIVNSVSELVDFGFGFGHTSLEFAVLRKVDHVNECCNLLINKFNELSEKDKAKTDYDDSKPTTWTLQTYLDCPGFGGRTVAHYAAAWSLEETLYTLHKHGCNFFLRDCYGRTAMEYMYLHAPQAVLRILDDGIFTTCLHNEPSQADIILFDFSRLLGPSSKNLSDKKLGGGKHLAETCFLSELVYENNVGANAVLEHILTKSFLAFKWEKMKYWFWMANFVQIFVHLAHIYFVVQVFLVECQYPIDSNSTTAVKDETEKVPEVRNVFHNYLLGFNTSYRFGQVFDFTNDADSQECKLQGSSLALAYLLFTFGGVLFSLKEMLELYLKFEMPLKVWHVLKGRGIIRKGRGVYRYLNTAENCLQLVAIVSVFWITVPYISSTNKLNDSHYSWAAIGVVVSWSLFLIHLGMLSPELGLTIQILGDVIKRLLPLSGIYIVFIVAFSMSFSVIFPYESPFQTLPQAMAKVLVMMTGEFEYNDLFVEKAPKILLTSHIVFAGFAMLMTIILMNLLLGMVVNDVQEIRSRSQAVQFSIKVDQISIMENSLVFLQPILLPLQRILNVFYRSSRIKNLFEKMLRCNPGWVEFSENHLDIYVVSPEAAESNPQGYEMVSLGKAENKTSYNGMTVERRLTDMREYLQQEVKDFLNRKNNACSLGT